MKLPPVSVPTHGRLRGRGLWAGWAPCAGTRAAPAAVPRRSCKGPGFLELNRHDDYHAVVREVASCNRDAVTRRAGPLAYARGSESASEPRPSGSALSMHLPYRTLARLWLRPMPCFHRRGAEDAENTSTGAHPGQPLRRLCGLRVSAVKGNLTHLRQVRCLKPS